MPTWSRYDVHGDTPIIIRPLGFEDEDCKGLNGLLGQLSDEKRRQRRGRAMTGQALDSRGSKTLITETKVAT